MWGEAVHSNRHLRVLSMGVDPELMIVNPMGMLITYVRGDRALVTG